MSLDTLPETVRHSDLVRVLNEKLCSSKPVTFDYWGEFKRLRETVSAQMGEMKVLFPKFTPHDEALHLARLFGIADKLLGLSRYEKMNVAELFLLACGLYAHDWGMAVGNEELDFMRSGATGKENSEAFTPLDDEPQRLRQFVESQGIRGMEPLKFPLVSDEQLRLYIRQTHAWRSGVRARAFFNAAGSSVPQALERVCQGHWLDFSDLDDEQRFSSNAGVLGQTVNLRGVALYVRMVDLFDISDDRTPYAIWRFVAPIDGVSQMEWKKHRALSPVTFPEYGDGRCVRFDGSTSDPEVWAELEDLRYYCEEQINGTMELMARHRDERHQLDIRKLDWAVTPERFKPVNIRFEFHRRRMFEILADEIYQGDSHVFLRELLQNSIDAVRMRRELVKRRMTSGGRRRDVGLGFDDAIYFNVQHSDDGNATVCCRDYGIGMDEYIVRNYLAVAGVSYYQSDEFKNLGLAMDPISRFGIGILSCFMVAQRIEIETCREPQTAENLEPLRIDVPAVDLQFRIYPASVDIDIGTSVTVHVLGKKLKGDVRKATPNDDATTDSTLQVTEYLRAVAGFVEFPIVIDENGQRTVILHPNRPASDAEPFRVDQTPFHIVQLSKEYSWDKVFAPQDSVHAQQHFREQSFDLRSDLGLTDYEGFLSYLRPVSEEAKVRRAFGGDGLESCLEISSEGNSPVTLRLKRMYGYYLLQKDGLTPSSQTTHALSIFRDGLLVAGAAVPNRDIRFQLTTLQWPIPVLRLNLPKKLTGNLDVARRHLSRIDISWDAPIWRAVTNYLSTHDIEEILNCEPAERVSRLGKLAHIFHLTEKEIVDLVPGTRWPLPMLVPNQGATIMDNQLVVGQILMVAPEALHNDIKASLGWESRFGEVYDSNILSKWAGDVSIAQIEDLSGNPFIEFWIRVSNWHLKNALAPMGVRFLSPAYPGMPHMPQNEFVCIEPPKIRELDLMEQTMNDPLSLGASGLCALRCSGLHNKMKPLVKSAPFKPPFESFFIGENSDPNLQHPTTIALLRCLAAVRWHQLKKTRNPADIGKIEDQLRDVADNLHYGNLQARLKKLWMLAKQCKFLDLEEPPPLSTSDYIPVSPSAKWMSRALSPKNAQEKEELKALTDTCLRPFGRVVDKVQPEDAPPEIIEAMSRKA